MTAIDELNALLSPLPGYETLTPDMKQHALDNAVVPDSFGVWPGQEGYETTYDAYWAAISLVGYLRAQPVIRQSSSEGTSVALDAPDWNSLTLYFKSMSVIAQATQGGAVLGTITIPGGPHVVKTNMREGVGTDDLDTDLS